MICYVLLWYVTKFPPCNINLYAEVFSLKHMYGETHAQLRRMGHYVPLPDVVRRGSAVRAAARRHLDDLDEGQTGDVGVAADAEEEARVDPVPPYLVTVSPALADVPPVYVVLPTDLSLLFADAGSASAGLHSDRPNPVVDNDPLAACASLPLASPPAELSQLRRSLADSENTRRTLEERVADLEDSQLRYEDVLDRVMEVSEWMMAAVTAGRTSDGNAE